MRAVSEPEKAEQQARAWDLWLDCLRENQIAAEIDLPRTTIQTWLDEKRNSADFVSPPASRQHFDIWQFQNANEDPPQPSHPPDL